MMMTYSGSRSNVLPFAFAAMLGTAGCGAEPAPPTPAEPACEPRQTTDPARLNIVGAAETFGAAVPCRATLQFDIARNTDLRAIDGAIRVTDADGQPVAREPISVPLAGPQGGMLRGEQLLDPVSDHSCRQLAFAFEIERCLGADDASIRCPDVRVRPSDVMRSLEASGSEVSVCYGD